jgi:protein-disulfide isomerase
LLQRRYLASFVFLALVIGCRAQTPPPDPSAALNRRIEVLVRSQYDLPPDVDLAIGARAPSTFPGYETLPVTISRAGMTQQIGFLISDDSSKLVHMDTLDLTHTPADNINLAGRPVRGPENAAITIINFDDLECPYCARMHQELFPETIDHYKGLVRFIYKDFPLVEIHPWAMRAAVDANCIATQSSPVYWTYVDYLHAHGEEITGPDRDPAKSAAALDRIARQEATVAKLDSAALDACLAKQDQTSILASMREGESLGISGTPNLYIDGERIGGAVPTNQLWTSIDRALRARGIQPPPPPAPQVAPAAQK